jgi:hypothetical protein
MLGSGNSLPLGKVLYVVQSGIVKVSAPVHIHPDRHPDREVMAKVLVWRICISSVWEERRSGCLSRSLRSKSH